MILLYKLSKKLIFLIAIHFLSVSAWAETKDIWKQSQEIKIPEQTKQNETKQNQTNSADLPPTVFDKEKINLSIGEISQSQDITDQEIIFGIFEPQDTKIELSFWRNISSSVYERAQQTILNSDKKSVQAISERILFSKSNINVFEDGGKSHLNFVSDWLINNKKLNLVDQVINQNEMLKTNHKFLEFLFTHYLSAGETDKACSYANLMVRGTQSLNLEKFKIFCFIHAKKIKQARSLLELTAETSKLDKFFINKTNFLIGLNSNKGEPNYDNVFNAHLTLLTNDEVEIKYENFSKSKDLRNYFFKSGLSNQLLDNVLKDTSAENKNKLNELVIFLERAVNEDLYSYEKILDIYKKYNFSFEQLFKVDEATQNLKRPESHAILYQAMLLTQKPELKIEVLNNFKEKLYLNGLQKIADPVYYLELDKIYETNPNLIGKKLVEEILAFKRSNQSSLDNFNNEYIYASELHRLFDQDLNKNERKKILKMLQVFDTKIKENQYELSNKDIAFLNILNLEKIDLPNNLSKNIYDKQIYIPNEVFNSLEKNENNEALLKTIIVIEELNDLNKNYVRDILSIIKIFDNMNNDKLKKLFIRNEFSL